MKDYKDHIDYATKDYEGYREEMLKEIMRRLPEYTDLSPNDTGVVIVESLATVLDIISYNTDVAANEMFLATARERESVVLRARELGYKHYVSTPAYTEVVMEINPVDYDIIIPRGTVVHTDSEYVEDTVFFELVSDLVIPAGKTGIEKVDGAEDYIYKTLAVEGESVKDEILGTSNGLANQSFTLNYYPVLLDSLEILVSNGVSLEKWERVENFLHSTKEDKHYTVAYNGRGVATITFGNDNTGAIPLEVAGGIVANYRVGGGTRGNVAPNTITEFQNVPSEVIRVFNPFQPLQVGVDIESIESIKVNAPINLRTQNRMVTEDDFRDYIMLRPEVLSADIIKDPEKLHVEIYCNLKREFTMTEDLLEELNEFVNAATLLGITCEVKPAKEKPVTVKLKARVMEFYEPDEVLERLKENVKREFNPNNCLVGKPIRKARLYKDLFTEGVFSLEILNEDFNVGNDEFIALEGIEVGVDNEL